MARLNNPHSFKWETSGDIRDSETPAGSDRKMKSWRGWHFHQGVSERIAEVVA